MSSNFKDKTLKEDLFNICRELDIKLNKKSGQCILIDDNIANFIIYQAEIDENNDVILEIGPGFGVLTEKIIPNAKKIVCIEKDKKIGNYLRKKYSEIRNFKVIIDDVLKIALPEHNKLISNVPYQISGPLIHKIINSTYKPEVIILMLQQEFIERMMAKSKPKNYGRMSVICGLFLNIEYLKKVPPTVFYPKPAINSGIIKITLKSEIPSIFESPEMKKYFFEFLSGIFPFKNKTIKKSISLFYKNIQRDPNKFSSNAIKFFTKNGINTNFSDEIENIHTITRLWQLKPIEIVDLYELLFLQ
ncbi:MAG: ribosomal RNA small subunit methyltransferase A [archaeon]|nr:ribosomal RNA small subunit methyltransferase A [archaeon]